MPIELLKRLLFRPNCLRTRSIRSTTSANFCMNGLRKCGASEVGYLKLPEFSPVEGASLSKQGGSAGTKLWDRQTLLKPQSSGNLVPQNLHAGSRSNKPGASACA